MTFTDLVLAVVNYGASIASAAERANKVKKCSPRKVVDNKSEYRWCHENYPQHKNTIDKIAGM